MRYKVKLLNPLEHSLWSLSQGSSVRFDRSLYALRLKGETGNAPRYPRDLTTGSKSVQA